MGFIRGMQGWFNISNPTNVILPINKLIKENYIRVSIDAAKASDKKRVSNKSPLQTSLKAQDWLCLPRGRLSGWGWASSGLRWCSLWWEVLSQILGFPACFPALPQGWALMSSVCQAFTGGTSRARHSFWCPQPTLHPPSVVILCLHPEFPLRSSAWPWAGPCRLAQRLTFGKPS